MITSFILPLVLLFLKIKAIVNKYSVTSSSSTQRRLSMVRRIVQAHYVCMLFTFKLHQFFVSYRSVCYTGKSRESNSADKTLQNLITLKKCYLQIGLHIEYFKLNDLGNNVKSGHCHI